MNPNNLPPTGIHPALLKKRLQQQKEQESKEYNKDKHPLAPKRHITEESHMQDWKDSVAYSRLMAFILRLNKAVYGKVLPEDSSACELSPIVERAVAMLGKIHVLLENHPCEENRSLSRFGNIAFRGLYDEIGEKIDAMVYYVLYGKQPEEKALSDENPDLWKIKEVAWYVKESFGNRTRIDYGTGHELNFCAFMCCLDQLGLVSEEDYESLVFNLYNEYQRVIRDIQRKYRLEPAGSRGVWGLDDYFFLIYVWGSSQLLEYEDSIRPTDIHRDGSLNRYKSQFLYFDAIAYIKEMKKGPFHEHSPLLNDISTVPNWKKINSGMIKMFTAEVLEKFVVVQHLCFGKCLPFEKASPST